eukprot:5615619-Pyramimonas_sp.AAC.2
MAAPLAATGARGQVSKGAREQGSSLSGKGTRLRGLPHIDEAITTFFLGREGRTRRPRDYTPEIAERPVHPK